MNGCGGGQWDGGYGMPSGCGCGQGFPAPAAPTMTSPTPNAIPTEPGTVVAPAPPAASPTGEEPAPAPGAMRTLTVPPTQNVSYEEFQRLPGTVISGPTITAGPMVPPAPTAQMNNMPMNNMAMNPSVMPRSMPPSRSAVRPASSVYPQSSAPTQSQQAVWIPAKPY